jgi:hypothetical protein
MLLESLTRLQLQQQQQQQQHCQDGLQHTVGCNTQADALRIMQQGFSPETKGDFSLTIAHVLGFEPCVQRVAHTTQ